MSWLLPGGGQIRIALTPGAIDVADVAIGGAPVRLGQAMLLGATSRAMPVTTKGGVAAIIDVGPLGWARLFGPSAERLRDRVTPLDMLMPLGWSDDLVACALRPDRGAGIKGALDDFFGERMPPAGPDEAMIARIAVLLADPGTRDLGDAGALIGIDGRALLRLTKRNFGFAPKLLLMRTRFLRALTGMLVSGEAPDFGAVPPGYHDVSHFIRDGQRFLGMTPRRFMGGEMVYLRAALRARVLVMGAAMPALDLVDGGVAGGWREAERVAA